MKIQFNSLYMKLFAGTVVIILFVGAFLTAFIATAVSERLHAALEKRAVFMAHELTAGSVNPILTGRRFELDMLFNDMKSSDADIAYVFAADKNGNVIAHTFTGGFPRDLKEVAIGPVHRGLRIERFETEQGMLHDFAVPIMEGSLGTLHLGISQRSVQVEVYGIVKQLLMIVMIVLFIGIAAAMAFARAIAKPVQDLARAAQAVGVGDLDHKLQIRSGDELGELADSFRDMISKRKEAEAERELVISELQEALQRVKTLQKLMPICASCKRIRDDKGYWSQLEEYLVQHSDVEFSHSICPECAKRLYPDFYRARCE